MEHWNIFLKRIILIPFLYLPLPLFPRGKPQRENRGSCTDEMRISPQSRSDAKKYKLNTLRLRATAGEYLFNYNQERDELKKEKKICG
jgi:hypothetical protein